MFQKIGLKARLLDIYDRNKAERLGPGSFLGASQSGQGRVMAFDDLDPAEWGYAPDDAGPKRVRLGLSEQHMRAVQAFAKRRRTTSRAALEWMVEKFVESGEFARLMDQKD